MTSAQDRLVPRWFAPLAFTLVGVAVLSSVLLSFVLTGVLAWSFRLAAVASVLGLVATLSALARSRRRHEPIIGPDGTRTFLAPAATAWPLVGVFVAVMAMVALWAYAVVTDFSAIESPGFTLVTIAAAVGLLPDLVRLLAGRLHRWRLELGPDALTYRGYRTDLTVPWSEVGRATVQTKGPAGVLINVRGMSKDPVVPILAFDVPAEQLVEEITRARTSARRPG